MPDGLTKLRKLKVDVLRMLDIHCEVCSDEMSMAVQTRSICTCYGGRHQWPDSPPRKAHADD